MPPGPTIIERPDLIKGKTRSGTFFGPRNRRAGKNSPVHPLTNKAEAYKFLNSNGREAGEVAERLKAPLSKSGILAKTGIVGSNPTLSATLPEPVLSRFDNPRLTRVLMRRDVRAG